MQRKLGLLTAFGLCLLSGLNFILTLLRRHDDGLPKKIKIKVKFK
ncbi:hypothetical protein [Lactiplantibacillus fabifermentans]|uniref:Uncharacterized protein n=1 Tax=Lactiplantibacillus fabifermentans T30PCM01 TaxID=1400520 RepID=W6T5M3_9LACO|nr:hypothetical protein [Lactiplantibacillus fabifermentans]ETY73337.1 hypothetical protein LFAB_12880 [Lactiplantibacillus fabifermentans T30PCM01]